MPRFRSKHATCDLATGSEGSGISKDRNRGFILQPDVPAIGEWNSQQALNGVTASRLLANATEIESRFGRVSCTAD